MEELKILIDEIEEDLDALKIYPTSADFPDVLKRIKHIDFNITIIIDKLIKLTNEFNTLTKKHEDLKQTTNLHIERAIKVLQNAKRPNT